MHSVIAASPVRRQWFATSSSTSSNSTYRTDSAAGSQKGSWLTETSREPSEADYALSKSPGPSTSALRNPQDFYWRRWEDGTVPAQNARFAISASEIVNGNVSDFSHFWTLEPVCHFDGEESQVGERSGSSSSSMSRIATSAHKAGPSSLRTGTTVHTIPTGSQTARRQDPHETARELQRGLEAITRTTRKPVPTMEPVTNRSATTGKRLRKDTEYTLRMKRRPLTRRKSRASTDKQRTGVTKSRMDTACSWLRTSMRSVKLPSFAKYRLPPSHRASEYLGRASEKGAKSQQFEPSLEEEPPETGLQDWLRQIQQLHQAESD